MSDYSHIVHPITPTYDETSRVLILGSFPSVKSREMGYFYGHPQNRFWRILAALHHDSLPLSIEERHAFLLIRHPIMQIGIIDITHHHCIDLLYLIFHTEGCQG